MIMKEETCFETLLSQISDYLMQARGLLTVWVLINFLFYVIMILHFYWLCRTSGSVIVLNNEFGKNMVYSGHLLPVLRCRQTPAN
jgi:hypothetical protein